MIYPNVAAASGASAHAAAPQRPTAVMINTLLQALEGLLRDAIPQIEFEYLKKGIGTSTPKGKAILAAQAAIAAAKRTA